jgi:hypothetical protein
MLLQNMKNLFFIIFLFTTLLGTYLVYVARREKTYAQEMVISRINCQQQKSRKVAFKSQKPFSNRQEETESGRSNGSQNEAGKSAEISSRPEMVQRPSNIEKKPIILYYNASVRGMKGGEKI